MPVLNHLGLTVADLDASVAFYGDVVGMELAARREPKVMGDWVVASAHLRMVDFTLQLLQYHEAGAKSAALSHAAPGSPHLCIGVDDVDDRYARLSAAGCHVSPMVEPEGYGFRGFYVKDPD